MTRTPPDRPCDRCGGEDTSAVICKVAEHWICMSCYRNWEEIRERVISEAIAKFMQVAS